MCNNFSHNILTSIETTFEERVIQIDKDTLIWRYNISIRNQSDKYIRLSSAEFSFINEIGMVNQVIIDEFSDENVLVKPNTTLERTGALTSSNHSSIVFGKIFAFNEMDEEFTIHLPTFSLDSPYYFYKTIQ